MGVLRPRPCHEMRAPSLAVTSGTGSPPGRLRRVRILVGRRFGTIASMTISRSPVLRRCLLVVAAQVEAAAILGRQPDAAWTLCEARPGLDLVVSGIGKANAAGAAARFIDPNRHQAILSLGIAGTLDPGLELGEVVIATASVFADEGVETPAGFIDCSAMGFPLGDFPGSDVPASLVVGSWLNAAIGASLPARLGRIATVSTCSGTAALASRTRLRTDAVAEAMEGAAVGLAAHRLGVPFGEVRVISNTTGDRNGQSWNIKLAMERLGIVIGLLAQAVRE
jgi:futalosine hydrolase